MKAKHSKSVPQRLRREKSVLQAAGLGVVAVLLLVLVFTGPTESFCSSHHTGCDLVTGFISTTLVAIAGYFFIVVWAIRRALPDYRAVAESTPERLLVTAGRIRLGDIIERGELAETIIEELHPSRLGAPLVVVGAAGTGKTTFLLELSSRLAKGHAVPVLCGLRGADAPLRLRDVAKQQFIDAIDPLVRSADHAERIWRRMCADGQIVLLADGLDEFMPGRSSHERDQAIRQALASVRNDRLPVVLTSRLETVPIGAYISTFELDPLHVTETIEYLEDRIPARSLEEPGKREALHDLADLGRTSPYYLEIIAGLFRAARDTSEPTLSREQRFVKLLDDWVDLIIGGRLVREVDLDPSSRKMIIDGLGALAHTMTSRCALESDITDLAGARGVVEIAPIEVVDGATRLGLLETFTLEKSTGVRFTHAISQAYFLSRLLRDHPHAWRELIRAEPSAEMSSALVMWCAHDRDSHQSAAVGDGLVERAGRLDADRALLMLVTAGEIASVTARSRFTALDGAGEWGAWQRASPRAQLAAIRRLRTRTDVWNLRTLLERTRDKEHYRVRWSAAQALAAAGEYTWQAIRAELEQCVATAVGRDGDWSGEKVTDGKKVRDENHDIAVACWMLPPLVASLAEPDQHAAAELVRTLAALVPGLPAGIESSLAQGFKLDALTNPTTPLVTTIGELLDNSAFWYSRINLAHALCIRAIANPVEIGAVTERLSQLADRDPHPFTAAAAGLCIHALSARDWRPWVWDDEIAIITRSGSFLDDDAVRLLADIVLLLNLTEQGDPAEDKKRERLKEEMYRRRELPVCLSTSPKREEIFRGCPSDRCPFNLCPYPATADRALARNEFSEAFCRHQSEIARRGVSLRRRLTRPASASWSEATGRAAAEFWDKMENRVT